ncbi:MAG TPA: hypothetical protein PL085_14580 [Agriterribacter sp.]|mgnify:CR=1 FL=1|uniref:IS66 family insertion sequence element accessory protein TnpA n=1 Tax=Agriterribacter sp. TaxID=2821509 RepID=UPI002BEB5309|nr:hypothetical protein [Agriterribacter sp.]HRQ18298.1 hypothetical protein [Agriterribacter sp.]
MRNSAEVRRQMSEMIERWRQSGLSQKSFCENESIKPYVFYYWYKHWRLAEQASENKSGFVKLNIEKATVPTSVEIHFPGGVRLVFHEPVDSDYLIYWGHLSFFSKRCLEGLK